jgi:twitching motility protein PilT
MVAYESELSRLVDELNRSTPGTRTGESTSLDQLLAFAAQRNASDIILVAGSAVALRVNGAMTSAVGKPISSEDLRSLLLPLLTADQSQELQENKSLDFCFVRSSSGRFRANFHYQRGTLAASIRLLPTQIPALESLHLPATLSQLTERRQDLHARRVDRPDQRPAPRSHHND